MHRTWALYKKEVRSYFVTPLFYVVAAVFLCLCGWFFYSDLNFFTQFGYGMDILGNFFQLLFVDIATKAMTFTVPLLTMRLFAEERKLGTIELLFTYPLRDGEIVAGKFLAAATVFVIMLAGTLLYPLYLYSIQPFPFRLVTACSVSVWCSSRLGCSCRRSPTARWSRASLRFFSWAFSG
jgi:ABC-type transport system involved in multi-copper enzyme maturation permease subunit